jgi:GNAT superfamily N-acetyltransferase
MAIKIDSIEQKNRGEKLVARDGRIEAGRAYVYFLSNELHRRPFCFVEDVFVEEDYRGQRLGTRLIEEAIERAKNEGCYKIVLTSRHSKPEVHRLYEKLGFIDQGTEFRIDL